MRDWLAAYANQARHNARDNRGQAGACDGLTTSVADAAGTTSYTYDGGGRLATLADPVTGTTAAYSYNSDSLVSGISYGTGKDSRSFGYDGMRRLTSDTADMIIKAAGAPPGSREGETAMTHIPPAVTASGYCQM